MLQDFNVNIFIHSQPSTSLHAEYNEEISAHATEH